ncbi:hypothetical protein BDQ17DRAFT_1542374 [Cyathus striatus]|nr:hypothetical protein BDQ17DRAFT_1542374 [Cyathus striatus]
MAGTLDLSILGKTKHMECYDLTNLPDRRTSTPVCDASVISDIDGLASGLVGLQRYTDLDVETTLIHLYCPPARYSARPPLNATTTSMLISRHHVTQPSKYALSLGKPPRSARRNAPSYHISLQCRLRIVDNFRQDALPPHPRDTFTTTIPTTSSTLCHRRHHIENTRNNHLNALPPSPYFPTATSPPPTSCCNTTPPTTKTATTVSPAIPHLDVLLKLMFPQLASFPDPSVPSVLPPPLFSYSPAPSLFTTTSPQHLIPSQHRHLATPYPIATPSSPSRVSPTTTATTTSHLAFHNLPSPPRSLFPTTVPPAAVALVQFRSPVARGFFCPSQRWC